jgi:hypothetical protein
VCVCVWMRDREREIERERERVCETDAIRLKTERWKLEMRKIILK